MKNLFTPKSTINDIKKYVPGKSGTNKNKHKVIKLSSNESPLGTSKKVLSKIKNNTIDLSRYPDGNTLNLRKKIAFHYNINQNNIICGNGSDELFFIIASAYTSTKDEVLYSKHGFLIYPIAARAAGSTPVAAEEKNLTADIESLVRRASSKTKVCFLANPNNPTGTYINYQGLKELRNKLPETCLLVIDSAYSEYVTNQDYNDGLKLAVKRNDVIVTHTFSKIYGMPSLRLGWAYCPKNIIDNLNKIRPAFNINSLAQAAAIEALSDKNFIKQSIKHNNRWKPWVENNLSLMGLEIKPSFTNFILVKFKSKKMSLDCAGFLESKNILVRTLEDYQLANYLRITIGLAEENMALIKNMKYFLSKY